MGYETFNTLYEAEQFAKSTDEKDYYGINKIISIEFSDQWFCWVVYFT